MRLDRLELYGFRNYEELKAEFVPGVNLIVGDNAQGKTNLLEAVAYLSTGRSFRTARQQELIRFGAEFAELNAAVYSQEREQTIRAVLFSSRRPRQLFLGGVKQRSAAALPGVLTTVLFCPDELLVLKNGSAGRRKLLDNAICQLRPNYAEALAEYGRLYENKSRILRDCRDNPSLLEPLPEFNCRMAQVGAVLIYYRTRYLEKLSQLASDYHREFSGGKETLTLAYQTVSTIEDPFADKKRLFEEILLHQERHYTAELESGQCLTGPHKDDFDACLDGVSIKSYGSQGQTRTASISLKLAERELLRRDSGEEPVLLLDDVLSELDARRQDFVLNQIKTGQVFITCCELDRLTDLGRTFRIENGGCVCQ
jgi:DNA replication and repair protein RecF